MSARGRSFSDEELGKAWAAGLWNRSFDAKKQFSAAPEPVIVGLAAAVYPATYAGTEASIDETLGCRAYSLGPLSDFNLSLRMG
jgi:hypothetical protein